MWSWADMGWRMSKHSGERCALGWVDCPDPLQNDGLGVSGGGVQNMVGSQFVSLTLEQDAWGLGLRGNVGLKIVARLIYGWDTNA